MNQTLHIIHVHLLKQIFRRLLRFLRLVRKSFTESGIPRIDKHRFSCFRIFKLHKTHRRKLRFPRIHHRNGQHIVTLSKNFKSRFKTGVHKIRHHDNHRPTVQNSAHIFKRLLQIRSMMFRLKIEDFPNQTQNVFFAFRRRNKKFHLIRKNQKPDLVVVADSGKRKQCGNRRHRFALHLLARAEF